MKYRFIQEHQGVYRVRSMCRVLGVSPSGYYAWRHRPESPRAAENRRLVERIQTLHQAKREVYGSDKTWQVLRSEGETVGRHRVARLRRLHGIEAKRMRRFRAAYASSNSEPAAPNLLCRNFQPSAPNRVWAGDMTYIPTRRGALHLAVLLDLYSRRVVGWAMSAHPNRQLVMDALRMAILQRRPGPGLIHHSDQGAQYTSTDYRRMLTAHDMVPSMSRKGDCYDNACVESFFSHLKNDLTYHRSFADRAEARSAIFDYIEVFYNRQRHHQTLGYQTPLHYEQTMGVA